MNKFSQHFPLLARKYKGNRISYLDNAATSPKPEAVISAVSEYYTKHNANIHRGPNFLEEEATKLYEQSRTDVARFINASFEEIIFTSGATASFNLVARSWGEANLVNGDVVAISVAEHHANIVPWLQLKEKIGIEIVYIEINEDGSFNKESLDEALANPKLKLLSLTQASNVLGRLHDLKDIFARAHELGVVTMVDAAQSIAHTKIDVKDLACDFLAFSGHKLFGPSGAGILYGKREILSSTPPFIGGGAMISEVRRQSFLPAELPYKFEAGTSNIEGVIGLGAAIRWLERIGWEDVYNNEKELSDYFLSNLDSLGFAKLLGGKSNRLPLFALSLSGIHPHDAADLLGEKGIITRSGHHCAQPLHDSLGIGSSLRVSLSFYNTKKEIDRFFKAIKEIHSYFNS